MTEIRCFRLLLLLLAATLLIGWSGGAYYLYDSKSALAETQSAVRARQQADRDCVAGIKDACPTMSPYDNVPKVLPVEDTDQRSFDINRSATAAEEWFVYSTAAALALMVLFYALRWAMTGRIKPFWPTSNS